MEALILRTVPATALVSCSLFLGGCGHEVGSGGVPMPTESILYSFGASAGDGVQPQSIFQANNGNFYGVTRGGGANGGGTVFEITPVGVETVLHSFASAPSGAANADGVSPASVIEGTDGNIYGVAASGGVNGGGIVFRLTPTGDETVLYSFAVYDPNISDNTDGSFPESVLAASDGNFYGITGGGGNSYFPGGDPSGGALFSGTIFKITPTGIETSFPLTAGDGPLDLIQGTDGNFYGLAMRGSEGQVSTGNGEGSLFEITPQGNQSVLYTFGASAADGVMQQDLIQGTDGNFYGVTTGGGSQYSGEYRGTGGGTFFKITPAGVESVLYSFGASTTDGNYPLGVIQGMDGNFYGVTNSGGAYDYNGTTTFGDGTVFRVTAAGTETVVYSFGATSIDGSSPVSLIQGMDGSYYGISLAGGASNGGTLFRLTVPAMQN
jgi:uncharacterized repeat protein (TIGR03803 family)